MPTSQATKGASKNNRRYYRDQLLRMATISVAFGWSLINSPARAADVSWGTGAGSTDYPVGSGVNADFEAPGVGPSGPTGVNLRFRLDADPAIIQGNRPIPGNDLTATYPATNAPAVADGLVGQQNPNTPLTGGLTRGNILLGIDSPDLTGVQTFSVELFNSSGDIVPANNITYSIIDLDRSCNREDDGSDDILWQDVVSTRVLTGGAGGTAFAPNIVSGPAVGAVGAPGSSSETVENITGLVGAGYTPFGNALTFRGISDPTPETLNATNGNTNCNDGNGAFPADNDDNRGIEAANNLGQPPNQPEGNVSLSAVGRLADRVEFQFGNGTRLATENGLDDGDPARTENLRPDPAAHGVGVLGDFSFDPAIIGISETSGAPVFQPAGTFAGQYVVKYSLLVDNRGEVDLTNVNVTNNLDTTFGAGNYTVVPGSITIDNVAQPDGFNGSANQNIPIPGTLAAGAQRIVMFEVAFDADAATAAVGQNFYENQSSVTANPIDPQTGVASTVYVVRDRSSHADTVATLNSDADFNDPDDVPAGLPNPDLPATFANPFPNDLNNVPKPAQFQNITRGTAPDNDPTNNDSPTIVRVIPQIGVTKQVVGTPVDEGSGSYLINYRQLVCNLSGETLNNVQLTEDLTQTFRLGTANGVTGFDVVSVSSPATAPDGLFTGASVYQQLTANAGFNGNDPTAPGGAAPDNVMATGTLAPGACSVVDFTVRVDANDPIDAGVINLGDGVATLDGSADDPAYLGQVVATGVGAASGTQVQDLSDDVTGLPAGPAQFPGDSDGDGFVTNPLQDPANPQTPVAGEPDNTPTPTSLNPRPLVPEIGLTKRVVNVVDNGVGPNGRRSYDVTFEYRVCNTGEVPLNGLIISDNYDDQFNANNVGPVANYQVISVTPGASTASGPLVADSTAVGRTQGSNEIVLASGNTLVFAPNTNPAAVDGCTGDSAVVQTVVRVFDPDLAAAYDSNAIARATSTADGSAVSDLSDDIPQFGTPDPANNVGTPGPGATPNSPADPLNTPTLIQFSPLQLFKRITAVTRSGVTTRFNQVVGSVPDLSFVGEVDIRNQADLQPGDSVEYTVYYFNSSPNPLTNVELCDPVPSPLSINAASLTATPAALSQTVISPLTPLSLASNPGRSCGASSGTQGAAVFNVGDVPAAGSGFIRFTSALQ